MEEVFIFGQMEVFEGLWNKYQKLIKEVWLKESAGEFTIKLCSDCDFEKMVADVYWKNYPLAMLNYDKGPEEIAIKIYPPPDGIYAWDFSLEDCLRAFELAKNYLLEEGR